MQIVLKNVRLSFPSLFQKTAFGDNEPKFEATFLIDKNSQANQAKILGDAIKQVMKDKWGSLPQKYTGFVGNGDDQEKAKYDGYPGNYYAKATSKKRVHVLDRDRTPLSESDGKPYGGCYVNAAIELFAWEYQNKKGVSAWLSGVQFANDGEPFGVKFDADKAFDQLDPIDASTASADNGNYPTANDGLPVADDDLPF